MDRDVMKPTWRKPAGAMLILLIIFCWALLVLTLADYVVAWPTPLQFLFFLVAGTVWILPLKPLLRWMELGRWRA
jgi:hypothetical protein